MRRWLPGSVIPRRLARAQEVLGHSRHCCPSWRRPHYRLGGNSNVDCLQNGSRSGVGHATGPGASVPDRGGSPKDAWVLDWAHHALFRNRLYHVRSRHERVLKSTDGYATPRCAWASVGCYHATNETLTWRLPLALGVIGPLMILVGVMFIPGMFYDGHIGGLNVLKKDFQRLHVSWSGKASVG